MCRGPSTLVRMQACVQNSNESGDYENPGSAPGTLDYELLGSNDHGALGRSDCDDLGGFGSFGSLSGPLILLQLFSCGVRRVQSLDFPVEV